MKSKVSDIIPADSLRYLVICVAGVAAMYLLMISPSRQSLENADVRIAELKLEIEEQQTLTPLMKNLEEDMSRLDGPPFPVPEPEPLTLDELEGLVVELERLAWNYGFEVEKIRPDTAARKPGQGMPLNFHLEGDWDGLRGFLIRLGGMGFIERVEQLQIVSGGPVKSFLITVILMTKN